MTAQAVWNRLKQREIAEVCIGELLVQVLQILRHLAHRLDDLLEPRAGGPEEIFCRASLVERKVAAIEQADRHIERLLRIVKCLERIAGGDVVVGLDQVDERLLPFGIRSDRHLLVAEPGDPQHVEHEHAVIGDDGAPALGHDGRMGNARLVAHRLNVIDDVVGVLLERVVHARLEVRLRAVVVDAQTAPDIQVLQAGAESRELGVHAGGFVESPFDNANVSDLAAQVKVEQLEAVLHAPRLQLFEAAHDLGHRETELRPEPAGRLPASAAAGGQLDAHADLRPNADLLRGFEDEPQLGVFLDHRDDVAADLQGEHRRLDELGVLESVADDRRVVVGERHDSQQLRLRPRFEAEPVGTAEIEHLFDDLTLLIDLDRINAAVPAVILVLRDGGLEGGVNLTQPVPEDVGEANQHRQADASKLQPIHQLLEVDGVRGVFRRVDLKVTRGVHRKVSVTPARHLVELTGVLYAPRSR